MFKIIKIILVTSIVLFGSSYGIAEEEKIKIGNDDKDRLKILEEMWGNYF